MSVTYKKVVEATLNETNLAGAGGVLGNYAPGYNPPSNINSTDSYATGDMRRPVVLGAGHRRKTYDKVQKPKKAPAFHLKKKKKKNAEAEPTEKPMFLRRQFPESHQRMKNTWDEALNEELDEKVLREVIAVKNEGFVPIIRKLLSEYNVTFTETPEDPYLFEFTGTDAYLGAVADEIAKNFRPSVIESAKEFVILIGDIGNE